MNECFDERLNFLKEREIERILIRKYECVHERIHFLN